MTKFVLSLIASVFTFGFMSIGADNFAHACSFNCSKSPKLLASGFVSKKDETAPFANSYKGETPSPAIANAESARVIVWLHGTVNPRKKTKCGHQDNLPPKSILQLDKKPNTYVYYLCSSVTEASEEINNSPNDGVHYIHGWAMGSYTLSRRDELEVLIDSFLAVGVDPKNIVLTGHSAGAWTTLLAAASFPEKFDSLVAFAPAFAGPRNEESVYPWWRQIVRPEQVAMVTRPNDVQKLVFAYENDKYNRPSELTFIEDAFPDTAKLVAQKCNGGHMSHKKKCNFEPTVKLINELIFD